MEHVEIDIQDLLQLQYDGVSVMNMFGKAKINGNLMLHFKLNHSGSKIDFYLHSF